MLSFRISFIEFDFLLLSAIGMIENADGCYLEEYCGKYCGGKWFESIRALLV